MIRVVLAVVLATALLGASLPAIDDARRDHTETEVRTELRQVERAATDLLETDDPTDDGARRVVRIRLPSRSWSDAGVETVSIGAARRGSGGRFAWTVAGGTRQVRRLPTLPLRTPDDRNLSFEAPGRYRLVLTLDGTRGEPTLTVRRFTREEGASAAHATVATDRKRRRGRRVRVHAGGRGGAARRRRRRLSGRGSTGLRTRLPTRGDRRAERRGGGRVANESFDRVPSGLPLAPPITAWYATTNVWHVTVRGEYARFGIRADRGRPSGPGADLTYARDGSAVTMDVDGERERLGRATRVDFDVSTTVVVVVPPGKSGVGDRDGNADERSDGWPEPGPD